MKALLVSSLPLVMLLVGCAVSTTPISTLATKPVPQSQIVNTAYQTPEPGDAHIIVKRDGGLFGSGCDFLVRIQGTVLASLKPGERIDLYVKPGDYILGASEGCGQKAVVEVEAQVTSGELKTYRLELDGTLGDNATFRFMPTAND
jgi:hypothetical protein